MSLYCFRIILTLGIFSEVKTKQFTPLSKTRPRNSPNRPAQWREEGTDTITVKGLWQDTGLTAQESEDPCEWLNYYNYPGALPDNGDINFDYSIGSIHDVSSPSTHWCAFCVLQAIKPITGDDDQSTGSSQTIGGGSSSTPNDNPTPYAKLYFGNKYSDSEMLDHGIDYTDIPSFYGAQGISVGASVSTYLDLVNGIGDDDHGLLIADMIDDHVYLMKRIHGSKNDLENVQCEFYDPKGLKQNCSLKNFDFVTNNWNMIIAK
jgi:hypothetical protein